MFHVDMTKNAIRTMFQRFSVGCLLSWLTIIPGKNVWCYNHYSRSSKIRHQTALEAASTENVNYDRRNVLRGVALSALGIGTGTSKASASENSQRDYNLRFPTLFSPLYGGATQKTIKRSVGPNIFALEQQLELGPLQTPLRCVVVLLNDGTLWVHAPLAPTQEFFELVESCAGDSASASSIAHVVVPTYAIEHKVFVKDALERWPNAHLWTSPGQFSFPFSVPEEVVFGKQPSGVLATSDKSDIQNPWIHEIEYETLSVGTFNIGSTPTTLYETAFFHKASKSLIVTDSLTRISKTVPPLNDPQKLLLISKRSTDEPMPEDTPEARLVGWEKTSLLVSYFFPEHEEPDPTKLGVVTWTDGWHDNFNALAGRLLVPPVVRTLLYAKDSERVQQWVDRLVERWDLEQVVPAHFDAPIQASKIDVVNAFRFLRDNTIDEFPKNDLARGLKPIADIALKRL